MGAAVNDLGPEVEGRLVAAGRPDLIPAFSLALSSAAQAYAPYSRFHVGAVITTSTGRDFAGCNVENASYPVGTCAERDALAAYVLDRQPGEEVAALALVAVHLTPAGAVLAPCSPCGACRQALREFGGDSPVHFFWGKPLALATATFAELLPNAFDLEDDG